MINSMRIINKYCPICDRKNSSDMDLGEFHLSMNLVCKNEYKYKFNKDPKFKYEINECNMCNHFWLNQIHPSLKNNNIKYFDIRLNSNEPEKHFKKLLEWFKEMKILKPKMKVGLSSYKDQTFLEGFKENVYRAVPLWEDNDLLNISKDFNGEKALKKKELSELKFDLILARHILEHMPNPKSFLKFIDAHLKEDGFIYLEVPSPKSMINEGLSYFIWEEHPSYFTLKSLKKLFSSLGFDSKIISFKNGKEPIFSIIIKKSLIKNIKEDFVDYKLSLDIFRKKHKLNKQKIILFLKQKKFKDLYFLGAGHLGIKAVSFFDLKDFLRGFIDDMKVKQKKIILANGLEIFAPNDIKSSSTLLHVLPPETVSKIKSKLEYSQFNLLSLNDIIN